MTDVNHHMFIHFDNYESCYHPALAMATLFTHTILFAKHFDWYATVFICYVITYSNCHES